MWLKLPGCHSDIVALPSNLYYFKILYFLFYPECFKSPAINSNSALFPVLCINIFCHQSWTSEDSHQWSPQQLESTSPLTTVENTMSSRLLQNIVGEFVNLMQFIQSKEPTSLTPFILYSTICHLSFGLCISLRAINFLQPSRAHLAC